VAVSAKVEFLVDRYAKDIRRYIGNIETAHSATVRLKTSKKPHDRVDIIDGDDRWAIASKILGLPLAAKINSGFSKPAGSIDLENHFSNIVSGSIPGSLCYQL